MITSFSLHLHLHLPGLPHLLPINPLRHIDLLYDLPIIPLFAIRPDLCQLDKCVTFEGVADEFHIVEIEGVFVAGDVY